MASKRADSRPVSHPVICRIADVLVSLKLGREAHSGICVGGIWHHFYTTTGEIGKTAVADETYASSWRAASCKEGTGISDLLELVLCRMLQRDFRDSFLERHQTRTLMRRLPPFKQSQRNSLKSRSVESQAQKSLVHRSEMSPIGPLSQASKALSRLGAIRTF